ncbi:MAG: glutamate synthase subunit alpha, partial [Saprospiraceae bacterium]|nr:glutamate synthase subunit alpha [Saprospiraceae bacterium]
SEITRRYPEGLDEDSYVVHCKGAGGQSFGAFIPKGLTLELTGDSNDYFGKGLSGGKLVVYPPKGIRYKAEENIIIGNVALYGATSGKVFINGVAGERFAVRNSGATAVVEGVGDHGCEYMTGGTVVNLGSWGRNFAAGMSGGVAYIYDPENKFQESCNMGMVELEEPAPEDLDDTRRLIREHFRHTSSALALQILNNWDEDARHFVKVMPKDYKAVLLQKKEAEAAKVKVG